MSGLIAVVHRTCCGGAEENPIRITSVHVGMSPQLSRAIGNVNYHHRHTRLVAGKVGSFERCMGKSDFVAGLENLRPKDLHLLALTDGVGGNEGCRCIGLCAWMHRLSIRTSLKTMRSIVIIDTRHAARWAIHCQSTIAFGPAAGLQRKT